MDKNLVQCPICKKIFRVGDTVATCQHKGVEGCNICSYPENKEGESCFVPLVAIKREESK